MGKFGHSASIHDQARKRLTSPPAGKSYSGICIWDALGIAAALGLPEGATLTLEQCWRLARACYKDKVKPDWRRHTLEETEALLAECGLTGPFWNLRG